MSERPSDSMQRPSKRRTEGQMTKDDFDNDDDDDVPETDPGTWKVADEETLKKRKIIKVRRNVPSSMEATAAPAAAPASANPFASISLTTPAAAPPNPFANITLIASQATPAAPVSAVTAAKAEPILAQTPAPATTAPSQTTAAETTAAEATPSPAAAAPETTPAAAVDAAAVDGAGGNGAAAVDTTVEDTTATAPPPSSATPAPASASAPAPALTFTPVLPPSTTGTPLLSSTAPPSSTPASGASLFKAFASSSASPFSGLASTGKPFGGFGSFGSNGFVGLAAATATPEAGAKPAASGFSFGSPGGGLAVAAAVHSTPNSVFGCTPSGGADTGEEGDGAPSGNTTPLVQLQPAEPTVTGEEDEKTVFSCDGILFEFDGSQSWKERGRGELRINLHQSGQARMVMRQRGNLRLLLNANLFPQIHVASMIGGKGVTFSCVNAAVYEDRSKATESGEEKAEPASGEGEPPAAEPTEASAEEKAGEEKDKASGEEDSQKGGANPLAGAKLGTYGVRIKQGDKLREFIRTIDVYKTSKPDGSAV